MPTRFLRNMFRTTSKFKRDERGAIAVEVALAGPLLVLSVLGLAETSVAVSDQQKLQAGAVAGAHYMHDVVARNEGKLFNKEWVSGETSGWQEGRAMKAARAIIADASNLDIDSNDIVIGFNCGCLQLTPIEMDADIMLRDAGTEPSSPEPSFNMMTQGATMTKDGTCKTKCADGSDASMLATIAITYDSSAIRGGDVQRDHTLTVRLG